jgi:nucleotidyltransferase/DNA polymerase involved in DNA repair
MTKKFDPTKSNLTAYQLENFKKTSTLSTPVSNIPGVGEITCKHFQEKFNINTIGDVVNKVSSYKDLLKILPKYVNSHRIYEALLTTFPDDFKNKERKPARVKKNTSSIAVEEELKYVSECKIS